MSYFASESGSVRAIAKMFENISTPMFFTNVYSKPEPIDAIVEDNAKTAEAVKDDPPVDETVDQAEQGDTEVDDEDKENVVAIIDGTEIDKVEEPEAGSPSKTNVYKHLKTYPIVSSWIKIFHWIPLPRIIRPRLMDLAYSNRLKPYTTSIDTYLDSHLSTLDNNMPFVKTLRMRDIRNVILDDPIMYVTRTTTNSIRSVSNLTQRAIIEPSRNGIQDVRELRGEYISFMGNQPLIRSCINPILKDVNNRMINTYLPGVSLGGEATDGEGQITGDKEIPINYVSINDGSNEFSHTLQLINLAVLRSRPILQERFEQLTNVPSETTRYVAALYKESEEHRGEGRIVIIIATLETIRKIITDGYKIISSSRFFQFLESEPTGEEKLSIAEEIDHVAEEGTEEISK